MRKSHRFLRFSILCFLLLYFAQFSPAEVLLSQPRTVAGRTIYPDDRVKSIFYYLPGELKIKETEGKPEFFFSRYRYTGTSSTGDSGVFQGRGIISFVVEFKRDAQAVRNLEEILKKEQAAAVVKPISLDRIQSDLIYTTIDEETSGKLEGGRWASEPQDQALPAKTEEGIWEAKRFTIGVNVLTTNLLWESYHKGGVILSLNYSLIARGTSDLESLPEELDKAIPTKNEPQEKLKEVQKSVLNNSLSLVVSPSKHPGCFESVDIGSEMPAGYTYLDIYCYDFQEPSGPKELFRKEVEVRGTSVAGTKPVQKAVFDTNEPTVYKHSVHFPFAMTLDKGYEYRIVRIDKDGAKKTGPWIYQQSWTGILDVTDTPAENPGKDKNNRRKFYWES